MKKKIAIFDIDGCISDDRWRLNFIPENPTKCADWDEYQEHLESDSSMNISAILDASANGCEILFVTARPEKFRTLTAGWLLNVLGEGFEWNLLMRPDGNMTPTAVMKVQMIDHSKIEWGQIEVAYDDRVDVLTAYMKQGVKNCHILNEHGQNSDWFQYAEPPPSVPEILKAMAITFEDRNAEYSENYKMIGPIMATLFPNGVSAELMKTNKVHLITMVLSKLTRFAVSDLTHVDSIHDAAVYCAILESEAQGK